MKWVFKRQTLQKIGLKFEVMGRGSEIQLQVGENLNYLI